MEEVAVNPHLGAYLGQFSDAITAIECAEVEELAADICRVYENGNCLFLCGNGGSGSNASHMCQDLAKGTIDPHLREEEAVPRLRVLALTDSVPYLLACANDYGYESVFVEQLKCHARANDVLICLSGRGRSPNILAATEWANDSGLLTWGLTGFDGGELRLLAARSLHVPIHEMGMVESVHLLLLHWVMLAVREHISTRHQSAFRGERLAVHVGPLTH